MEPPKCRLRCAAPRRDRGRALAELETLYELAPRAIGEVGDVVVTSRPIISGDTK